MAKQTSLGNFGGAQSVSLGGKSTPTPDSLLPPTIAYLLHKNELDLTDDGKFLIGVRIEFRDTNGLLINPRIRKVYFEETPQPGKSYFSVSPESTAIQLTAHAHGRPVTQNPDKTYQLNKDTIIPAWVDNHKPHKKLRFYNDIDFVFFPMGPLSLLTKLYNKLIISGYRFETGGKLNLEQDDSSSSGEDDEVFFALKMEGYERISTGAPDQKVAADSYPDTVGTDVLFGHPCPPMWQQFLNVADAIVAKKGMDFFRTNASKIRASWLDTEGWNVAVPAENNIQS